MGCVYVYIWLSLVNDDLLVWNETFMGSLLGLSRDSKTFFMHWLIYCRVKLTGWYHTLHTLSAQMCICKYLKIIYSGEYITFWICISWLMEKLFYLNSTNLLSSLNNVYLNWVLVYLCYTASMLFQLFNVFLKELVKLNVCSTFYFWVFSLKRKCEKKYFSFKFFEANDMTDKD